MKKRVTCEMEITLDLIVGKWKPMILYFLIDEETKRFGEIKSFTYHTSQKTLTTQLRQLEEDGLISRKVYSTISPKVEYSATDKGKSLFPILELCVNGERQMLMIAMNL